MRLQASACVCMCVVCRGGRGEGGCTQFWNYDGWRVTGSRVGSLRPCRGGSSAGGPAVGTLVSKVAAFETINNTSIRISHRRRDGRSQKTVLRGTFLSSLPERTPHVSAGIENTSWRCKAVLGCMQYHVVHCAPPLSFAGSNSNDSGTSSCWSARACFVEEEEVYEKHTEKCQGFHKKKHVHMCYHSHVEGAKNSKYSAKTTTFLSGALSLYLMFCRW